ncbi:MAG TPA: MEDS domain-containing protein [Candidatus Dormibacteraeota bacterium]
MAPGDHICALYMGDAERDEILFPYLKAGMRAGDKVVCIVDQEDTARVRQGISDGGDVDASIESGQVQLHTAKETYAKCGGGRFCTDDMINFWDASLAPAMSGGGFRFARIVGEMSWALRELPELDELSYYESEYNRFAPRYGQWGLCLYDLERFGGGILVDVLKTHPRILLGGMVLDNPHYLSPDEFLAQRS